MIHSTADSTFFDTNNINSLSTKSFISSTEQVDESSINFLQSFDKQIALYSQNDMTKTDLFWKWWNLISYKAKFLSLKKNIKWREKATHKKNIWSHFIEKANVMQEESKVICTLCQKNLTHFSIKKSEIKALWNHLNFKKCKKTTVRFFSLQKLLNSYVNKVSFMIYHINLSYLLTSWKLNQTNVLIFFLISVWHHLIIIFSCLFLKQIFFFV